MERLKLLRAANSAAQEAAERCKAAAPGRGAGADAAAAAGKGLEGAWRPLEALADGRPAPAAPDSDLDHAPGGRARAALQH